VPDRRQFLKASAAGLLGASMLRPRIGQANPKQLDLVASNGQFAFGEDPENTTPVMHYNQSIPGPLIRIPQGRESIIRLHNSLDEPTSVHWHGLRMS
jgi:FtsP/CotA-like multicopper oxidase with cupredoxin domain